MRENKAISWEIRTVAAVRKAAREHGGSNSFAPIELSVFYGGPTPMQIGRVAHDAASTLTKIGYPTRYIDRRFHVAEIIEGAL